MTKIKKYGVAALVVNLLFMVVGTGVFLYLQDAIYSFPFGEIDQENIGPMSLWIVGLVAAIYGMLLLIPLVHAVLGGFNSLMMLLQILTGKAGFSALPIFADILIAMINGSFMLGGLSMILDGGIVLILVFSVPFGLAVASLILHIKAMSVKEK